MSKCQIVRGLRLWDVNHIETTRYHIKREIEISYEISKLVRKSTHLTICTALVKEKYLKCAIVTAIV